MNNTLTVSIPDPCLNPNKKAHWAKEGKARKKSKEDAYFVCLGSQLAGMLWDTASTDIVYYHNCVRVRDGDNHLAMLKGVFDGFAAAFVVKNDSGFRHNPVQFKIDKENPRVEITIKPIQENR